MRESGLLGPATGTKRSFPWGHEPWTPRRANLDQLALRPSPVGAHPQGASPCDALGMLGDVWE